ncbi:MAG: phosphatase PAP2 family protein [Pseudomonadota bacterium]
MDRSLAWWPSRALARFDHLERRACLFMNRGARVPLMAQVFTAVSRMGDGVLWYGLMVLLPLTHGARGLEASVLMAVASLIGLVIYRWMKARTVRERPCVSHPDILLATAPLDRYSFPSGHTLHAVLFTTIAVAYFPLLAAALIPFTALVALSRVILGLHYPTDVLVGALIGWALASMMLVVV